MKKPRKQTRRGIHYRALAEGCAMLNSPIAESFITQQTILIGPIRTVWPPRPIK